jgi:hypothetical protein
MSVTAASVQDRDALAPLLGAVHRKSPWVTMSFVDGGYQGEEAQRAAFETSRISITVVKRTDKQVTGFIVLPKRWVVNRRTISLTLPISNGRRAFSGWLEGAGFAGWRPTSAMERVDLSQAISNQ